MRPADFKDAEFRSSESTGLWRERWRLRRERLTGSGPTLPRGPIASLISRPPPLLSIDVEVVHVVAFHSAPGAKSRVSNRDGEIVCPVRRSPQPP